MNLPTKFSYSITRGRLIFVHKDSLDASCAFSLEDMPYLILSLSRRAYIKSAKLVIYSEDCKSEVFSKSFAFKQSVGAFDEYELALSSDENIDPRFDDMIKLIQKLEKLENTLHFMLYFLQYSNKTSRF